MAQQLPIVARKSLGEKCTGCVYRRIDSLINLNPSKEITAVIFSILNHVQ